MMSLPAMSFGDRTVGGGWVHPKCAHSMVISGLSFRNTLVGTGWAASVLLRASGLRKRSFHLLGPPIMAGRLFSHLHELLPAKRYDYCKLVSGWVWFESWTCRGWLQEHLCEVWGWNLHRTVRL